MSEWITPRDLERETGVDQKTIRVYLRELYGYAPYGRWRLDESQAHQVRGHFEAVNLGLEPDY